MHNQHRMLRVLQLISILQKQPAKSIRHLSTLINATDRTVYRYLDLIKALGFELTKDNFNKYFIITANSEQAESFTPQEAKLISDLIQSSGKHSKLKDSILKKVFVNNQLNISANHLLKANVGKLVETLSKAIQQNKQVILKKYHSANSQTINDRLIEPIQFTDNYTSLAAYEIASGQNKYFNIERIGDVKLTNKPFAHHQQHQFKKPDAFGFGASAKTYEIKLRLNLRAYVILKEEYPAVSAYIKAEPKKQNSYVLSIAVNDVKPITRFVMGLIEDVEIIGSDEFIEHLQKLTQRLLINKK